jgi:hypothetical protein
MDFVPLSVYVNVIHILSSFPFLFLVFGGGGGDLLMEHGSCFFAGWVWFFVLGGGIY